MGLMKTVLYIFLAFILSESLKANTPSSEDSSLEKEKSLDNRAFFGLHYANFTGSDFGSLEYNIEPSLMTELSYSYNFSDYFNFIAQGSLGTDNENKSLKYLLALMGQNFVVSTYSGEFEGTVQADYLQ